MLVLRIYSFTIRVKCESAVIPDGSNAPVSSNGFDAFITYRIEASSDMRKLMR
jgi:hypothetical protein